MNYNSKSNKTVYVDIDTLTSWSNQISEINENSIQQLESLSKEIENLNSYWEGNFATGFIDDTTALVGNAKLCHNDMKSVPTILMEVVNSKMTQ